MINAIIKISVHLSDKRNLNYNLEMRSKKSIETIEMHEGEYLESEFYNYVDMASSAVDWTFFCPYQLQKNSLTGVHKILELPSMQIAYTDMCGGIMFDFVVPEDCLSFSVMKYISNKACLDQMKLKTDMIAVMDDKKIYNFMYNSRVNLFDISLKKNSNPLLLEKLAQAVDKYYIDHHKKIAHLLQDIIDEFRSVKPLERQVSKHIEKQITEAMLQLISEQEVSIPHFTKSEKIAITIKKQLFLHMDGKMHIASLAKEHNISEKSLQNSFRSLYDLKPIQFMRLLKLNLVHNDLMQSKPKEVTVLGVAQKWGFAHMGRFCKYYTELFGENPSVTLKTMSPLIERMSKECVERKEEIV